MENGVRHGLIIIAMSATSVPLIVMLTRWPDLPGHQLWAGVLGAIFGAALAAALLLDSELTPTASVFVAAWTVAVSAATYVVMVPLVRRITEFGDQMHGKR